MLLSILIPTINGREHLLNDLLDFIESQRKPYVDITEIVVCKDNKEISIGQKRQWLLDNCKGEYFVMIDDDDMIHPSYLDKVIAALESKPDCIGYLESVVINGYQLVACHSDRWDGWANNAGGFNYVRTIFYKDVIKTSIAREIGFKDLRYGEDHDFSIRLKRSGLLKKEVFINEMMYYYTSHTISEEQRKERYGIK